MYIKNSNLNVISDGCYILKQDLRCSNGTFLAGTKVKISLIRQGTLSNVYEIKSADADDNLYLDEQISAKEWADKMLEEDTNSTTRYQAIINDYDKTMQSIDHSNSIKESIYLALLIVLFIIGFLGFFGTMNKVTLGVEWVFGMILGAVLIHISKNAYYKDLDKLRDNKEQQCHDILAS